MSSPRLRCGGSHARPQEDTCPSGDPQHPAPRASGVCPLSTWSQGHLPGRAQASSPQELPGASQSLEAGRAVQLSGAAGQLWKVVQDTARPPSGAPSARGQRESDRAPNPMADRGLRSPRRRQHPPPHPGREGGSEVRSRKSCKSRPGKGHRVAPGSGGAGAVPGQILLPRRPRDGAGSRGAGSRVRAGGEPAPRPPPPAPGVPRPPRSDAQPAGSAPSAHPRPRPRTPPRLPARAHLRRPGCRRRRRRTRPPRRAAPDGSPAAQSGCAARTSGGRTGSGRSGGGGAPAQCVTASRALVWRFGSRRPGSCPATADAAAGERGGDRPGSAGQDARDQGHAPG